MVSSLGVCTHQCDGFLLLHILPKLCARHRRTGSRIKSPSLCEDLTRQVLLSMRLPRDINLLPVMQLVPEVIAAAYATLQKGGEAFVFAFPEIFVVSDGILPSLKFVDLSLHTP